MECSECLYTSKHPFGLEFNSDGLCTGCITHKEKLTLDWEKRFKELEKLAKSVLGKHGAPYDCVVPVRGTPEYFYVLDIVKNVLGLRPLVVSYNSHFNSQVGIHNIDLLRDTFDVDFQMYATNKNTYQKLVREMLYRFGNLRWPFIAGETSFPIRVADQLGIPLVIWPYHQPTEQVGMHSYVEEPEMSRRSREEFDLMGLDEARLTSPETLLTSNDLSDFRYPKLTSVIGGRIRSVYLANFVPWDSRAFAEIAVTKFGARASRNWRTFDTYDRVDDLTYMSVHDLLKFSALGYARVRDSLCREIRFSRLSRNVARELEEYYQIQWPTGGIKMFSEWLEVNEEDFLFFLASQGVEEQEKTTQTLSSAALEYIAGFIDSGFSSAGEERYLLYGKGIELTNVVTSPQQSKSSNAH